jgi:hypothetical protein
MPVPGRAEIAREQRWRRPSADGNPIFRIVSRMREHTMTTHTAGRSLLAVGALTGLAWAAAGVPAAAQQETPNFSSRDISWLSTSTDLIPVPGGPRPTTSDSSHPYVPNGTGAQPTFRVADLTNPNIKPWAKEVMKRENEKVLAGTMMITARSSCMPAGVPGFFFWARFEPNHFVQTPTEVTMIFSGDAQVRHVYLNVPHSEHPKPSWYGESVGHYEGDTLVIDTVGFNARTDIDGFRTPHTDKLHTIERWRLTNNGQVLEGTFTIDDPETFNQPWSAIQRLRRVERPMHEEACAENNTPLFDYHMPVALKPDF